MNTKPDYYRLLHVRPEAPAPVIKASYRAMMQKMRLHPDLGGDEVVAGQLNEAVAILCDPHLRSEYDRQRNTAEQAAKNPAPGGSPTAAARDEAEPATNPDPGSGFYSESAGGRPYEAARDAYAAATSGTANVRLPAKPNCPFCHAVYPTDHAVPAKGTQDCYGRTKRCSHCHGAATPISHLTSTSNDDLRKIYRHDHKTPVLLWSRWPTDAPISARMTDLSLVGCALQYNAEIAVNTVVLLDSPLLNGIGKIRHSQLSDCSGFYLAGLEFLTLQITAEPGSVFSATA